MFTEEKTVHFGCTLPPASESSESCNEIRSENDDDKFHIGYGGKKTKF